MNRASGTYGIQKGLILILKTTKKKEECGTEKNFWRNKVLTCPKFDKRHEFSDSKSSVNPKQDKHMEI